MRIRKSLPWCGFALVLSIASAVQICGQALSASAQPPSTPEPHSVTAASSSKAAAPENPIAAWNVSVNEALQHDSSTGWSDIVTPGLIVRPARHFTLNAVIPWYPTLAAYSSSTTNGTTTTTLTQMHNVLGDAAVSAFAGADQGDFTFIAGASAGFPTGDRSLGVGAGTGTYHFGAHVDYSAGRFSPEVEAGIGNSSAFANRVVRKAYTAVGQIANFQAGTSLDLPGKFSLDLALYEAMPLQTASISGTIGRSGTRSRAGGKRTLQSASGSSEDNGFNFEAAYPITQKLALAAGYDRSFIQADDVVSISLNWLLRSPRRTDSSAPASPLSRHRN